MNHHELKKNLAQNQTSTKIVENHSFLEFETGKVLLEKYRVVKLLGQGGMGSVYEVEDFETGNSFALKFLHKQQTNDATWRRFDIEAKTANKLDHPNLIKVYETGLLPDGQPFFIMDLVAGEPLSDILKQRGRLTLAQSLKIFIQVGFALSHAHENGVIHRDIKPSNIMLQRQENEDILNGLVKVVDFGIAKLTGQDEFSQQTLTKTGEIFGSPLYMSPEQCMGVAVDHRSDLYSLGCVFYETLTGAPPLVGENALSTMLKHQSEKAIPLKEASLGIEFPEKIETIVARLLAKEIGDRYQSAQLMTADLVNFESLQNNPIIAIGTTKVEAGRKINVSAVVLAALSALTLCGGMAAGYFIPHPPPPNTSLKSTAELLENGVVFADAGVNPTTVTEQERQAFRTNDILKKLENSQFKFSRIDLQNRARIFKFPPVSVGLIGVFDAKNNQAKTRPAIDEIAFPLDAPIFFSPNKFFKDHPDLFKHFGESDIQYLDLIDRKGDILIDSEPTDINKILKNITYMKSLRRFEIGNVNLRENGWECVNAFPNLTELFVSQVNFPPDKIATYKHFQKLQRFSLIVKRNVDPVLEKLRGSKNLRILTVVHCHITDRTAPIFASFPNLTDIELSKTQIGNETIKALPATLLTIDIRGCTLNSSALPYFKKFKKLRSILLDPTIFSPADLKKLKTFSPNLLIRFRGDGEKD